MAQLLKGAPVAASINEFTKAKADALRQKGIIPTLAILRVGERPDDIAYENGACKRAEAVGVAVLKLTLPANASEQEVEQTIYMVNDDTNIHGVLLLRPLPKSMNEERLVSLLAPEKDVDGITDGSLCGIFTGKKIGYAPCTAQACMEILNYYGIDVSGKKATVVGRSLVIGRPVAMLLMEKNATVTICHTRTKDLPGQMQQAELIIAAVGRRGIFGQECFSEGQIVLDVGIHFDDEGKMCGDVRTAEAEPMVAAITPVPGGVGSVTTAVLMRHVVDAAWNR